MSTFVRSSVETEPRSVSTSFTRPETSPARAKFTGMMRTLSGMSGMRAFSASARASCSFAMSSNLRDADDVPHLLLAEPLRLEDEVERLVPGHVAQGDGHLPGHVVGDDDVLLRDVRDEPQQVADVDVVEVERDAPAGVAARLRRAGERVRGRLGREAGGLRLGGAHHGDRRGRRRGGVLARSAANVQARPSFVCTTSSFAAARSVATTFTWPVEGWLKEETMSTGPWNALVSSDRSSFFGISASSSERTTVRASGRESV